MNRTHAYAVGAVLFAMGCSSAEGTDGSPARESTVEDGAALRAGACKTVADCPAPGAPCRLCDDGSVACPSVDCVRNRCVYEFPQCPYVPCAGKTCGETCTLCNPADPLCIETAVIKYCDPRGQCQPKFPLCTGACGPGQEWCPLNGRCTDLRCLSCCMFGSLCTNDSDCKSATGACVTCADGSTACSKPSCGAQRPGQCFFPEPRCP